MIRTLTLALLLSLATSATATYWTRHQVDDANLGPSSGVKAADMDGDGDTDLVVATAEDGIQVAENIDGLGQIWTVHDIDFVLFSDRTHLDIADINGDGWLDILSSERGGKVTYWQCQGYLGEYSFDYTHVYEYNRTCTQQDAEFADIDEDGDLDIVAYGKNQVPQGGSLGDPIWVENTAGDGSDWVTHYIDEERQSNLYGITTGDFTGNGHTDLLAGPTRLALWENTDGTGLTWNYTWWDQFSFIYDPQAVDMDGDGHLDFVARRDAYNYIWWYKNNGDGSNWQGRHVVNDMSLHIEQLRVADMEGDGDYDVVCGDFDTGEILIFTNSGDNYVFDRVTVASNPYGPYTVQPADIDMDGDLDLAVSFQNDHDDNHSSLVWYEQPGSPAPFAVRLIPVGPTVIPPGGGTLTARIVLTNQSADPRPGMTLTVNAIGPGGTLSPTLLQQTIALPDGSMAPRVIPFVRPVPPGVVPPGEYNLRAVLMATDWIRTYDDGVTVIVTGDRDR